MSRTQNTETRGRARMDPRTDAAYRWLSAPTLTSEVAAWKLMGLAPWERLSRLEV
jgi:hypothetical protein